jgi:hypothetical protein
MNPIFLWQKKYWVPMYIEKSIAAIRRDNKEIYLTLIVRRKKECDNDSQVKRLEKSFKQIIK